MDTRQVTVSGTVGKQVFATTYGSVLLRGLNLSPLSAAAYVAVRDGNASGTVVVEHHAVSNDSKPLIFPGKGRLFRNGMHVKVLGTNAKCYLFID